LLASIFFEVELGAVG